MQYKATILDFQFSPMVDGIPSDLRIRVFIKTLNLETTLNTESGSIESLSKKFDFEIVNEYEWDFKDFEGRKCIVEQDANGFRFISFVED